MRSFAIDEPGSRTLCHPGFCHDSQEFQVLYEICYDPPDPKIPTNRKWPCLRCWSLLTSSSCAWSFKRSAFLPHHRVFLSSTLIWPYDVEAQLFHEHLERVFWGCHRPRHQLCPLKISLNCWSDPLVFLHDNLVSLVPICLTLIDIFDADIICFSQPSLLRLLVHNRISQLER